MGGPRIMVFQMKEIIKIGMIILIGLILVGLLIFILVPRGSADAGTVYNSGTYAAQIILHNRPVDVEVTVNDREITNIELKNMNDTLEVFYPLFKPTLDGLSKQVIKYQSTRIATDPDTAVTSRILLDAIDMALSQAVAQ